MNTTPDTLSAPPAASAPPPAGPAPTAAPPAPPTTPSMAPPVAPPAADAGTGFDWRGSLGGDYGAYEPTIAAKGWKGPGDALRSYAELEKRFGTAVAVPAADAPAEEWAAFYAKAGRPEQPDGYGLKRPDDFPEELYNTQTEAWFRATAHQAGLTDRQAQAVHGAWVKQFKEMTDRSQAQARAEDEKTEQTLRGEWGQTYERNLTLAQRAAATFAGPDLVDALIGKGGSAGVVKMFAEIGRRMGEDSLAGPAGGASFAPADPAAARRDLDALQADPENRRALLDRSHAKHAQLMAKKAELFRLAYPDQRG